jgi:hypothetical protein
MPKVFHIISNSPLKNQEIIDSIFLTQGSLVESVQQWTFADVERIIQMFTPELLSGFKSLSFSWMKVFSKYYVLYVFGGIVVEPFFLFLKPMDDSFTDFVLLEEDGSISQRIFGFSRSNQICRTILDRIIQEKTFDDLFIDLYKFESNFFPMSKVEVNDKSIVFPNDAIAVYYCNLEHDRCTTSEPVMKKPEVGEDEFPKVLLSILARNKGHVLPLYLRCISCLDYPKKRIHVYIHTNNNNDDTVDVLQTWSKNESKEYLSIEFVHEDFEDLVNDVSESHRWQENRKRLDVLAGVRQRSLGKTLEKDCDYYFVSDCDNFLLPNTLTDLVKLNLRGIVSPALHCAGDPTFSNFFLCKNDFKSWRNANFQNIVTMKKKCVQKAFVVHCTYLVDSKSIRDGLTYVSILPGEWEFMTFAIDSVRLGIPMYIDNRHYYGVFLHFWQNIEKEKKISLIKLSNLLFSMKYNKDITFPLIDLCVNKNHD